MDDYCRETSTVTGHRMRGKEGNRVEKGATRCPSPESDRETKVPFVWLIEPLGARLGGLLLKFPPTDQQS